MISHSSFVHRRVITGQMRTILCLLVLASGFACSAQNAEVLSGTQPKVSALARVIAIPDADQTPEMLAGLSLGLAPERQFARRLAENGCEVLIPVLIDRQDTWSGNARLRRFTNQPHREWIYRQAYEMGRHIIGYEAQKIFAAVDWFKTEASASTAGQHAARIGIIGYAEGGLLALYSAALDTRIDAAV